MTYYPCVTAAAARKCLPSPAERRAIRETAGVSLRQIAIDLGVTPQCVALWEADATEPKAENAVRYIEVLMALVDLNTEETS